MSYAAKKQVRSSLRATKSFVERLGGRLTAASGAFLEKGDGRVPGKYRIETKRPPTGKYRFTYLEWRKVWLPALRAGEQALFHLAFPVHELVVVLHRDLDMKLNAMSATGVKKGFTLSDELWNTVLVEKKQHFVFQLTDAGLTTTFVVMSADEFVEKHAR